MQDVFQIKTQSVTYSQPSYSGHVGALSNSPRALTQVKLTTAPQKLPICVTPPHHIRDIRPPSSLHLVAMATFTYENKAMSMT